MYYCLQDVNLLIKTWLRGYCCVAGWLLGCRGCRLPGERGRLQHKGSGKRESAAGHSLDAKLQSTAAPLTNGDLRQRERETTQPGGSLWPTAAKARRDPPWLNYHG